MGTNFQIDHQEVWQNAQQMSAHGEDYVAALARLRERGAGGAAWGDDGLIGEFTMAYGDCLLTGMTALTGLGAVIGDTGGALGAVVARTRAAEEGSRPDPGAMTGPI
ncbi:hypothetical protein [Spongiactinospora sp. TRM90649]|uniref:hypothetical protein n=1 Tax=Spongiactinospora sp. TRM90649 TaxID=3031114 RepID=UPI0023FA3001|nr:hypothetical protein [Spongiactinospora sp. TRM90649]MDF5756041.1 hypothetical protein [Spongiactinospora sp. TRM90649]